MFKSNMNTSQRAEELYQHIKDKLKGQEGKIVALELESKEYFLGDTTIEAYHKGRIKHPHQKFFFMRVGSKAAYHVGFKL